MQVAEHVFERLSFVSANAQPRQPRSQCAADVAVQTVTDEHDASGRNIELGAKTLKDFSFGIDGVEF